MSKILNAMIYDKQPERMQTKSKAKELQNDDSSFVESDFLI
jgi:hypothetical protein